MLLPTSYSNITNDTTLSTNKSHSSLYQISFPAIDIYNNSLENCNLLKVITKPPFNNNSLITCSIVQQSSFSISSTPFTSSKTNSALN